MRADPIPVRGSAHVHGSILRRDGCAGASPVLGSAAGSQGARLRQCELAGSHGRPGLSPLTKEAHAQWRVVADQLRGKFERIGNLMDAAGQEVLSYMEFPKAHWLQIHSTNPLERLNAEIKRRTNVVGIFPNDRAITRLVGAMLLEQSDEWTLQRRYMQLEGLQTLSDTAPARLPAVQR